MKNCSIVRLLVCLLAVWATARAEAAVPADNTLTLGEVGLPVFQPRYDNFNKYSQPSAVYPISTARAPNIPARSQSTEDVSETWSLAAWTVGRTLSEQAPGARLGDFCTDFPVDPSRIDWARTVAQNQAAVAEGRLLFDLGAEDPYQRVIFTASGATEITWAQDVNVTTPQTYNVGSSSSARPYRIFATRVDEANSAAFIDLSGKFVKFFGDSELLKSVYAETAPGVSNVVYGLDYDPSKTKMLTVRYTVDEKTGAIKCPQGQFVLAYYDTETKDHMVAHIVVEICPPNVNTLNAEVGEALKPAGGGYATSNLYAVAVAGLERAGDDPYSPYLEQYTAAAGEEVTDPNHGKVFAVAPTDVTTSPAGMAMPWKADIYWQTADPMRTKWTFEHDWYLVNWPADPLRVVVAPTGAPAGCPFLVPTNYTVMTGFRMPADVSASFNALNGEVSFGGGDGAKILVKVLGQGGKGCPWYLPVELTDYRSPTVASPGVFPWPVGIELTPRIGVEAGSSAAAMSRRVDDALPGFIYESESPGRNWNPRLYHRPSGASVVPDSSAAFEGLVPGETSADPYEKLKSAIYGVNENLAKIQVWWRANFQDARMAAPITYPALVQNYMVTWEATMAEGLLPAIALSSERGSSDPLMTACSGRSLLLVERGSTASVNLGGRRIGAAAGAARAGFSCYVPAARPGTADGAATPGRLARWCFGEHGSDDFGTVDAMLEVGVSNDCRVVFTVTGGDGARTETRPLKPGEWSAVSVALPASALGRGVTATYGAADSAAGDSATLVSLDNLALWTGDTAAPTNESDVVYCFSFAEDSLRTLGTNGTARTATDALGNALSCRNCSIAGMGAPKPFARRLVASNGVSPEIYYENDAGKVGYNPNEEHAFMAANGDVFVAWALRNDLNKTGSSQPVVMVMYAADGKGAMQAYRVVTDSADYSFGKSVVVGNLMLPPAPIGKVPGSGTANDFVVSLVEENDGNIAYQDRKGQHWARRDGIGAAFYSYPMQPGFWCPSLGAAQLAEGTLVGWMNCTTNPSPTAAELKDGTTALPWMWTATWPATNAVPTMRVGQVLTVAEQGLPEVWNAASMAIAYPTPTNGVGLVAELIDPTVRQCSAKPLPIEGSFPDEYGFTLGASGTTFLRKGKYYFTGLPPSVSDRFYIDTNADPAERMCLVGQRVVKESGGTYLQLNVLTDAERTAIKAICTLDVTEPKKKAWDAAVDSLATEEVVPAIRSGSTVPTLDRPIRRTYSFPSERAYTKWITKARSENWKVATVINDFGMTYEVVTGPKPAAAPGVFYGTVDTIEGSDMKRETSFIASALLAGGVGGSAAGLIGGMLLPGTGLDAMAIGTIAATLGIGKEGLDRWVRARKYYKESGLEKFTGIDWDSESKLDNFAFWTVTLKFHASASEVLPFNLYLPRDHYALVANGDGCGWVTLIENDNPDATQVKPGLPVSMKLIRVVPELYVDGITVLTDPLNKLSEQLTLQYRTPLGSAAANYEFEWRRATPASDGTLDTTSYETQPWNFYRSGDGLYSILLGANGARPDEYVNTYYTLRYRAKPGTPAAATVGTGWSAWAPEQLAEGWLQRVLNSVTPFAQRVEDFYANKTDPWLSMLEQIGRPYQGDVALNNDNLANIGLLELYQTLFNRAESVLQASGAPNVDMSKQLMLAQTRMGEFYSLLGAEAYSDAKNPLVQQPALDSREDSAKNLPSSVFCFANQVSSLLDEELALLRGRTAATAYPRMTEAPCYNRLAWNFTKDMVEGEPAYVANYGIRAREGVMDVNCAAAQYPQGHGDAWGHYLSALTGYWRLLRNPLFDWTASMTEMLMDQKLMNVDYQDEEKFADAVAKLARTGLDAMELTVRKVYRDEGRGKSEEGRGKSEEGRAKSEERGGAGDGYFDSNREQAFGYGEWATRTGLAAAYGWMTANALLPTNDAPYKAFTDKGIRKIDRTTAAQLPVICETVRSLENRLAATEAGLNPLGLSEDAIPFDIDPDRLSQKDSHFEQILERAEQALANCKVVLDYANVYGTRIAQISKEETALVDEIAAQELAYNSKLIAIYGTPFSGDIGPGGTYPQGYEGPDLYNYNYMDLAPYGLDDLTTQFTNTWRLKWGNAQGFKDLTLEKDADGNLSLQGFDLGITISETDRDSIEDNKGLISFLPQNVRNLLIGRGEQSIPLDYSINYVVSPGGIRQKPASVTGVRATEGSIQAAYRNYLIAYKDVENAISEADMKLMALDEIWKQFTITISKASFLAGWSTSTEIVKVVYGLTDAAIENEKICYQHMLDIYTLSKSPVPKIMGAGTTVITDPNSVYSATTVPAELAELQLQYQGIVEALAAKGGHETVAGALDLFGMFFNLADSLYDTITQIRDQMQGAALDYDGAVFAISEKFGALSTAEAAYRAEVYKGDLLQEERAAWRAKLSSSATTRRYLDMYNRVERNAALAKYQTAFDTAQRYVWELAKVYDYETGLLSTDPQSGKKFLADIVATRSLGQQGVTIDSATTDGGLYDVVHRLKENWSNLKGRYGVNNPDKPEKWFSLRYELFRIRPDAAGDAAWRRELRKYWVDDIRSNADFARHCQPLESEAVVIREPGLVIPFATSVNNAENFFGRTLQGGESQFSSADYATKIAAVGVDFPGYERLTERTAGGLAVEPNIYLVPVGSDYMRAPAGNERKLVKWNVVDQVLPLPYAIGSTQLDDVFWISSFAGLDGTSDSVATIRRHSTLRAGADFKSTRLVGRSVWNDRWVLVIPASSLNADRTAALETFVNGIDDIKLGIKAYSRQGN